MKSKAFRSAIKNQSLPMLGVRGVCAFTGISERHKRNSIDDASEAEWDKAAKAWKMRHESARQ